MSKPQVKSTSLNLSSLMKIKQIKMPIFQRKYSWGEKGKTEKALEYFKNFLTSDKTIDFFGTFLFYSEDNISINSKTFATQDISDIDLYLSDGQHRLVTLYLVALSFSENKNCPNYFMEYFNKIISLNIEIITETSNFTPVKLDKSLILNQSNIAIHKSYVEISDYLKKQSAEQVTFLASRFENKIKNSTLSLNILMPNDSTEGNEESIEDFAFDIFNQLNGQSIPLTPSELMQSILFSKHNDASITKALIQDKNNLTRYSISQFVGLKNKEQILRFFSRYDGLKEQEFKWVNKLHKNGDVEIDKVNKIFDNFQYLKNWLETDKQKTTIKFLYYFYMLKLIKIPQLVFIIKNIEFLQNDINFAEKSLKLLILLETITAATVNKTGNISRDLKIEFKCDDVFLLVLKHFGIIGSDVDRYSDKDIISLKIQMINKLKEIELGDKFINLSKMFLLINEIQKNKNFNSLLLSNCEAYEYEHVWARKYKFNKDYDNIPIEISETYQEMQESKLKNKYINLIGNGVLLTKTVNAGISNSSPYEKIMYSIEKNTENHYWSNYFNDLKHTNGEWGIETIEKRTEEILINVTSWLLDYFIEDKNLLNQKLDLTTNSIFYTQNNKPQKTNNKNHELKYTRNNPITNIQIDYNGITFFENSAIKTLIKFIEHIGVNFVFEVLSKEEQLSGLYFSDYANEKFKTNQSTHEYCLTSKDEKKYYLYECSSTDTKVEFLEKLQFKLNLDNIKVTKHIKSEYLKIKASIQNLNKIN